MGFVDLKNLVNKDLLNAFFTECKKLFADKESVSTVSNSLETHSNDSNIHITAAERSKWNDACEVKPYIRVKSSTPGSTKIFRLTIDDTGLLTGEEETTTTE